jgi:hypothetical protein
MPPDRPRYDLPPRDYGLDSWKVIANGLNVDWDAEGETVKREFFALCEYYRKERAADGTKGSLAFTAVSTVMTIILTLLIEHAWTFAAHLLQMTIK